MKYLLIIASWVLFMQSSYAQNSTKLLNDYLQVKNALVKDDFSSALEAAKTFDSDLKAEAEFKEKKELLKAADKMIKAKDIEGIRAVFNTVSVHLWKLVKRSKDIKGPVYYQYCPMKKAYWLSTEKTIENPYYGASMLHCGSVRETKE